MSDWTAGYVADIGYTYGYYTELNPLRTRLALLNAQQMVPGIETACELGFGQGLSTNIHAAASGVEWYGTDFNPSQAAFARDLAAKSGAAAKLYDDAFADFANRTDLPDFDYIAVHGIWSWISDANREIIVEFIRRKLKVGGILYISYNTLPGWSAFAPMRHLMTEHADIMGSEGRGIVSRIDDSIEFASRLMKTNPLFASAYPHVGERLEKLRGHNRHYLAHEYFNRDWHPMHFSTMAKWLAPAKLGYACSAHYPDHIDVVNLSPEQQTFLKEIPDLLLRESVRDFMVNQQFRRDYWVKGPRTQSALARTEALRAQKVTLIRTRASATLTIASARGEVQMNAGIYDPILDVLADQKPKTFGQIESELAKSNPEIKFGHILEAVMLLTGSGQMAAVQDDATIAKARKQTERLNNAVLDLARGSGEVNYLASPVIGGGVPVTRFQQMFLRLLQQGVKAPADWAQPVWQVLVSQGQKIVKDGNALDGAEAHLAELRVQAQSFADQQVPVLKALGII